MQSMGAIEVCSHCKGSGVCTAGKKASCMGCIVKATNMYANYADPDLTVICSACEGKGKVWIGPNTVPLEQAVMEILKILKKNP